jgi:biotin carboxyl carrier protein
VTKKTYQLSVGDKAYRVDVEAFDGKRARVKVDGKPYEVEVNEPEAPVKGSTDAAATPGPVTPSVRPAAPEPPQAPVRSVPSGGTVIAPMPGLILDILVALGDQVPAGTPVVKMEAMKMENEIPAPVSGTVKTIAVKVGDNVSTDQTLMVLE